MCIPYFFTFTFRLFETILIAMVTTFVMFILAVFLGTCVPVIKSGQEFSETQNYFCPSKGQAGPFYFLEYFNDMATLVFNSEEAAIKQLFHQDGTVIIFAHGHTLIVHRNFCFLFYCCLFRFPHNSAFAYRCVHTCNTGHFVDNIFLYCLLDIRCQYT